VSPAPLGRLDHVKLWLGAALLRGIIGVIGLTVRVTFVSGESRLLALPKSEPVILTFWHDRLVYAAELVHRRLVRRGCRMTVLVSSSRDGELGAKVARMLGVELARGSASRGGTRALRGLYRAVTREGCSPIIIPDGPKGPRHEAKRGVVVLSQMTGAPILPLAYAAERAWKLGSWDRLIIPRPFTRIVVAVGEPRVVPRGLDDEALEGERVRLEQTLDRLVATSEERAASQSAGD
jgi:lysophospholipid acyltransferase (LPLAT)-like uncharacterized protein